MTDTVAIHRRAGPATAAEGGRTQPSPAAAMANSTDSELAARFAAGDNACIAEVIELHQPGVVRLAARMLGGNHQLAMDDLVQEVFVRAIEKRNQFQQTSTLKTWLTSITLNQCRAYLRKQRRRKLLLGWWQNQNHNEATASADARVTTGESAQQVREAIARLPTVSREIVVLHYLEELSIDETAQALGITAGAAATRLSRARAQLRNRIDPTLFHD